RRAVGPDETGVGCRYRGHLARWQSGRRRPRRTSTPVRPGRDGSTSMNVRNTATPRNTSPAVASAALPVAYRQHARDYDRRTSAFAGFRRAIVAALPLSPGDVVLDVGCGTGLCFPMLLEKI